MLAAASKRGSSATLATSIARWTRTASCKMLRLIRNGRGSGERKEYGESSGLAPGSGRSCSRGRVPSPGFFPAPCSPLPASRSLLPAPCSPLPAPRSWLKHCGRISPEAWSIMQTAPRRPGRCSAIRSTTCCSISSRLSWRQQDLAGRFEHAQDRQLGRAFEEGPTGGIGCRQDLGLPPRPGWSSIVEHVFPARIGPGRSIVRGGRCWPRRWPVPFRRSGFAWGGGWPAYSGKRNSSSVGPAASGARTIRSPCASLCRATRLPFTATPWRLRRSWTIQPSASRTISACLRERCGESKTRSHTMLRPSRTRLVEPANDGTFGHPKDKLKSLAHFVPPAYSVSISEIMSGFGLFAKASTTPASLPGR